MTIPFRNPMTGVVTQVSTPRAFVIGDNGDPIEVPGASNEADVRAWLAEERIRLESEDPKARRIARIEAELAALRNS